MIYNILADIIVFLHFGFILFVIFGAFLVFKYRWVVWVHLPIAAYGMLISFYRWICPLTPLENYFLELAGKQDYEGSFIGHYIMPIIYPAGMTKGVALSMGLFVLLWNGIIYGLLIYRYKKY